MARRFLARRVAKPSTGPPTTSRVMAVDSSAPISRSGRGRSRKWAGMVSDGALSPGGDSWLGSMGRGSKVDVGVRYRNQSVLPIYDFLAPNWLVEDAPRVAQLDLAGLA